jgi:hypothetical protein
MLVVREDFCGYLLISGAGSRYGVVLYRERLDDPSHVIVRKRRVRRLFASIAGFRWSCSPVGFPRLWPIRVLCRQS